DEAIQAWYESATPSSRGRPQRYSDLAITTVLVIKRVFRLTLRAAQGFIDSIFSLMNVPLRCPDYSCVSRRAKSVTGPVNMQTVSDWPLLNGGTAEFGKNRTLS
ncbi:TPA: transposase, partial [Escherichia coli]